MGFVLNIMFGCFFVYRLPFYCFAFEYFTSFQYLRFKMLLQLILMIHPNIPQASFKEDARKSLLATYTVRERLTLSRANKAGIIEHNGHRLAVFYSGIIRYNGHRLAVYYTGNYRIYEKDEIKCYFFILM
jgi:hypothetical protein